MTVNLPGEKKLENRPSIEAKALRINLNEYKLSSTNDFISKLTLK